MKMRKPVKRNPMARDLATNPLYRPKTTKSAFEKAIQRDAWHRKRKHKGVGDLEPAPLLILNIRTSMGKILCASMS